METIFVYESWDCPNCGHTNFPQTDEEETTCMNCKEEFELNRQ